MKLNILTGFIFLLFTQHAIGQIRIKGRVIDKEDGFALPKVTVLIDSTQKRVAADLEGYFEAEIPENSFLIFSFLGYKSQKVKPVIGEFLLIKLKVDCISDHFDSKFLFLNSGIDLVNDQFGLSVDYTSRFHLPLDFKASASYYFKNDNRNINTNISILDLVHSCEFELEANFRYQYVDMANYEFRNSIFSVEPSFDGWTAIIGFGLNKYQKETTVSNNLGLLVGMKRELEIGKAYIPVSISSTFWQNNPEINVSAQYSFLGNFRFKLIYQRYKDFNSIIGSLGVFIRTWDKAD